jgi:hypothetical protein
MMKEEAHSHRRSQDLLVSEFIKSVRVEEKTRKEEKDLISTKRRRRQQLLS